MKKKLPYDKTDPASIEAYGKLLEHHSFRWILESNYEGKQLEEKVRYYEDPNNKGSSGYLVEVEYFTLEGNRNAPEPDIPEANVDIKTTPYIATKITKTNTYRLRAKEKLVISMIPYHEQLENDFMKSKLFNKMNQMIMVFYLYQKGNKLDQNIDYVWLFQLLKEEFKADLVIIMQDYKTIVDKVNAGKAHELSSADTHYLCAATKGKTADLSYRNQVNTTTKAKSRSFALKAGYVTSLIRNHMLKDNTQIEYESIFSNNNPPKDFDTQVLNQLKPYIGKTEDELYKTFHVNKRAKQSNYTVVCRMLGIKSNKIAEFEKANTAVRTIRLDQNGKPKESMPLRDIKLKQFAQEDFYDSNLYQYFNETRFLLVVFQENKHHKYTLIGFKFYNMPLSDLEGIGQQDWNIYQTIVKEGIQLTPIKHKNKVIKVKNNLPNESETNMFHMRPRAKNTAYLINGKRYGKGNEKDMDAIPNTNNSPHQNYMTKQCFWINKSYIASIVKDLL